MNNIIHYHIQKQKKIRLKPRINLNYNIPNNKSHMQVYQTDSITALVPFLSMRKGRLEFQFWFYGVLLHLYSLVSKSGNG